MKIVFICASLEPGSDGVGDYTRRIAAGLAKAGDQVNILAFNDRFVSSVFSGSQWFDDAEIPVKRLPSTMPVNIRIKEARDWVDLINPTWISLQYVIFMFHPRGLKFGMSKNLLQIANGRRWHLMVHELWVGMDRESTAKHQWWGRLQRQLILSLIRNLKPKVIHTQTKLYQLLLKKMGYQAHYLPLISNIPVLSNQISSDQQKMNRMEPGTFTFIIFGNIHHGAPVEQFVREATAIADVTGVKLKLKIAGRCGSAQEEWINAWKAAGLAIELTGKQPAELISAALLSSSAGIVTTPWPIADKSGSLAAMYAHGLPVICVARDWHPHGLEDFEGPETVFNYKNGNLRAFMEKAASFSAHAEVGYDVSAKLSEALRDF
jgi:glycosyltransferase involved in cell wall biosynthesis